MEREAQREVQIVPKKILQRPTSYRDALQGSQSNNQNLLSSNAGRPNNVAPNRNETSPVNEDFVELKQQIKVMQDQMHLLLSLMKPQAPQTHPTPTTMGWGTS